MSCVWTSQKYAFSLKKVQKKNDDNSRNNMYTKTLLISHIGIHIIVTNKLLCSKVLDHSQE